MTIKTLETDNVKIKEMFEKGAHFGYSSSVSHPKMKSYFFAQKNGVELFDLEKTKKKLDEAKTFMREAGRTKGIVLFVGTKKEAKDIVTKYAKALEMPFVTERWLGGTLTNFSEIRRRLDFFNGLVKSVEKGEFSKHTKRERFLIDEKITKMRKYFGGLDKLIGTPAAVVVVDTKKEKIAVDEAKKKNVPVVGLMNGDCNPKDADYIIPANDSSVTSIEYFLGELVAAYNEGVKEGLPVKKPAETEDGENKEA